MRHSFSGIWGTFEYLDDFCTVVQTLREKGYGNLTTHAPCPRREIDEALGNPQSPVPFETLVGGLVGGLIGIWIIVHMTLDWILPVSAKPILSIPIMGPIVFEMSVLLSIYFTIFGIFFLIIRDMRRTKRPSSKRYREYDRFLRDRFGIVVPCKHSQLIEIKSLLEQHHAEEVIIES